ncbi:MAG: NifB/NifX family molybdenum-iron cluster-binding protein [Actinobacteria bacterium]|nr:NifB/NifX family molybdenum-iron cluster-binding protein [Actinomycetota bacterium]
MKIAIPTEGIYISPHFGRCPSFTIAEIEGNKVVNKETIDNPGHEPGLIPEFLKSLGVNTIIAAGMGSRATDLFNDYGISYVLGVDGKVDDIIASFIKGELKGGESSCEHGAGKGYGFDKSECDHRH